jgi:hypothetical protein
MAVIEKAGMLVNAANEVVGWLNKGDDVEMQEGDVVISHHKSAEKVGLLKQFKALKEENKPAKAPKVEGEAGEKKPRQRMDIPKEGKYKVLKPGYANDHTNPDCAAIYTMLTSNDDFGVFFQNAKPYTHIKRDGSAGGEITPSAVVSYALRRGVIEVA